MIANELNKKPSISFGLGKTEKTISLGDAVTIYQNIIFNDESVRIFYNNNRKSTYSFNITPTETGVHPIQVLARNKITLNESLSNIITLTVE